MYDAIRRLARSIEMEIFCGLIMLFLMDGQCPLDILNLITCHCEQVVTALPSVH